MSRIILGYKNQSVQKVTKQRGRPPVNDPATEYVHIRVTPAEKARYFQAAKDAGVKLSAWLKSLADRFS